MIERFSELKKDLTELATVLNQFKSEAVQLRLLELLFDVAPDDAKDSDGAPKTKRRAKRRGMKTSANVSPDATSGESTKEKPKKAAGGSGAVATLNGLVAGNFFKTHKTIGNVVEHSKTNLARTFKASDFSGALGRLVRNGELTRKKNTDGQYEYQKP